MKKKLSFAICLLLCILLAFSGCTAPVQYEKVDVKPYNLKWENNGDIETIKKRICESLVNPEIENVEEDLNALNDDGSYSNVDYDSSKTDTWHPIEHLKKTVNLQVAYNTPDHPFYKNKRIKPAVAKAMKYWADNDFKCEWNWWWNDIGIGLYMPDILLLGVDGMTEETEKKLLSSIHKSLMQNIALPENIKERPVDATGGNLTDQAMLALKIAVIENDGNTIMWIKSVLENELRVFPEYDGKKYTDRSDAEGIKADMSFQQHDQLIYFGGYGEVFMDGINQYLKYTKDTQFALNEKALNLYTDFILDGIQYAARGEYRDINSAGRGIVRVNGCKGSIYSNIKNNIDTLLAYDGIKRKAELKELLKNRYGEKDMGAGGYKYFYLSDMGVYNGQQYMATVRHASESTRIYEEINGENPLGFYGGLGATFFYVDGDEYFNALPLFNWNRIPGTTSRQGHIPLYGDMSYGLYNKGAVSGGASIESAGVSFFSSRTEGVKSKKAYFMFEKGVVCLGADIASKKQDKIVTNLNQTLLKGDVVLSKDGKIISFPKFSAKSGIFDFIYHNKIAYISNNRLHLETRHVDSDWKKINTHFASSSPVSGDIFELDIFHGARPKEASYDYTILMDTTVNGAADYVKNPTLKTVENSSKVQAVYDVENDILEAVFHESASLTLPNGSVLIADKPCVVILEGEKATVASTGNKEYAVKLTLNKTTKEIKAVPASSSFEF